MEQPIKITTRKAEENMRYKEDEEQAVEFILDEIITMQTARDTENDCFSQIDERMKNLVTEYNAGQYTDNTVLDVIVGYSQLTVLHTAISDINNVDGQDELDRKMEILKGILNGDQQAAADVLRKWQIVPRTN